MPGVQDIRLDNIHFTETQPGKLWITTFSQGATLIDFEQQDGTIDYDHPTTRIFGSLHGLPEGYIKTNSLDKDVLFRAGSASTLYRFDASQGKFFPDTIAGRRYGLDSLHVFPTSDEQDDGSFLSRSPFTEKTKKKLIRITPRGATGFQVTNYDISRIFESTSVITYEEENGFIWQIHFVSNLHRRVISPQKRTGSNTN
jgi:hypothetical protein